MLNLVSLWLTAILFGGMSLFPFGLAAFLLSVLPNDTARATLRRAFPPFYLFVLVVSMLTALLMWRIDYVSSILMATIALSVIPTRQALMPAINRATDSGQHARFKRLHGLSVAIGLAHIALSGYVLARFV